MLDDNDIKKLGEVFTTKDQIKEMLKPLVTAEILEENNKKIIEGLSEVFVTKTDFEDFKDEYREGFSKVLNPVDKKVGEDIDGAQEKVMLEGKVQRHEKWIGQIAKKVDIKLES